MTPHRERKPMRLSGYDYSLPGAYFVTACTKDRDFLFETPDTKWAVESAWHSVLEIFANLELDEFVVMQNHIHGIVWIIGEGSYRIHPGTWKDDFDIHRRDGRPSLRWIFRNTKTSAILSVRSKRLRQLA